jgi:oxygen-independent coproporphyrinogen-3 oxidase
MWQFNNITKPSLYIHIPFCRRKCLYCDFYSINYKKDIASSYIDILCRQIKQLNNDFSTIYIGGGTPTVLEFKLLKKFLKTLRKFSVEEFTIEANPESLTQKKIKLFLDEGINRLSIGIQSLKEEKLKKLGRLHSEKEAKEAVFLTKRSGFKNVNIDLIFGVWQENFRSWQKELKEATELPITHISCYSLTYEKGTPLYREVKAKRIIPLEDKKIADMYKYTLDYLPKKGFLQYEVSNFSKKGYQCKHNLNYWQNGSYLGLGPSASSYIEGVRSKNISSVKEYIKRVRENKPIIVEKEKLSLKRRVKEYASLKIRCKEGIDFEEFRRKTGFDFWELEGENIKHLIDYKLIKFKRKNKKIIGVALTKKGFLFSDTASAYFV